MVRFAADDALNMFIFAQKKCVRHQYAGDVCGRAMRVPAAGRGGGFGTICTGEITVSLE